MSASLSASCVNVTAVASEVQTFLEEYNNAFAAGDTARIRDLYVTNGFRWSEDGVIKYSSVKEIFASLAAVPAGMKPTTTFSNTRIEVLGADAAAVQTEFETAFSAADGDGFEFGGVLSMVVRRTAAGWRVASGHTSTAREGWQGTGSDEPPS